MKLKTLFRRNLNGDISYINLESKKIVGKDEYEMLTTTGTLTKQDAKISSIVVKEGKNKGKKNETTPQEQANSELESKHKKLQSEGYTDDLNKCTSSIYNTFSDNSDMPMLLNKYNDVFKECYAQRKYDGVRCVAEYYNGQFRLKSREGKIFNIPHILNQFKDLFNNHVEVSLDGELYKHGKDLHDIISAVKNDDPKEELIYVVYDVLVKDLSFERRRNLLLAVKNSNLDKIQVDEGVLITTEDDLIAYHNKSIELGYEGSIVCDPEGLYRFGFRTNDKCKIKPRETEEFICIAHYYNKGKMSKQSTLICQTKDGREFHVKLKGTNEQREKWAKDFDTVFKDKPITVEYRKLSKYGVPLEPVGLVIRDYE